MKLTLLSATIGVVIGGLIAALSLEPNNENGVAEVTQESTLGIGTTKSKTTNNMGRRLLKHEAEAFALLRTARIDIKNQKTEANDLTIRVSDPDCTVWNPAWFRKNGMGYQLQSQAGKLDVELVCFHDGELNITLRGIDMRSPLGSKKRIPLWVDYTRFIIDGDVVFDAVQPVWHDKPYRYQKKVVNGQKLKVHLEWRQHEYSKDELEQILKLVKEAIK